MEHFNRREYGLTLRLLAEDERRGVWALKYILILRPGIASASEGRTRGTLLNYAVYHRLEFVVALLEAGADPNARATSDINMTPLLYACGNREHGASMVSCLLAHGADPHAKSADGKTALHHAARRNNVAICKLLIAAGSDVNAKDNEEWEPLEFAVKHTAPKCIETLLAAGAKVTHHVAEAAMRAGSPRGLHLLFRAERCCVRWAFFCIREEVRCINVEYLNRISKLAVNAQFVCLDAMTAADDHFARSVDALISHAPSEMSVSNHEFAGYEAYERDQRRGLANIVQRIVGHRVPAEIGDIIVEFWGHPGGYVVF